MKLGDGVETAIHCTTSLAGLPEGAVLSASSLAEFHGVSASYLVKHLKALVSKGVLFSVAGPSGGYRLGRAAEAITLLDIVLAVEGPEPAFRCGEIRQRGPSVPDASAYPLPCGISVAMLRAERAYRAALAEVSIRDLVTEFLETSDARVVRRGVAFVEAHQRIQPSKG